MPNVEYVTDGCKERAVFSRKGEGNGQRDVLAVSVCPPRGRCRRNWELSISLPEAVIVVSLVAMPIVE